MTGRHRTHPSRWEVLAWAGLEAFALTLVVAAVLMGMLAVSVLLP
jgi:hypothetical protein